MARLPYYGQSKIKFKGKKLWKHRYKFLEQTTLRERRKLQRSPKSAESQTNRATQPDKDMVQLGLDPTPQSVEDLARWFGTQTSWVKSIGVISGSPNAYNKFKIPKARGGERVIHALPKTSPLRSFQEMLYRVMTMEGGLSSLKRFRPSIYAHGFVKVHTDDPKKKRSILSNARVHQKSKLVIRIDLQDFFPNINFARIRGLFMNPPFNFGNQAATIIAQGCCLHQYKKNDCDEEVPNRLSPKRLSSDRLREVVQYQKEHLSHYIDRSDVEIINATPSVEGAPSVRYTTNPQLLDPWKFLDKSEFVSYHQDPSAPLLPATPSKDEVLLKEEGLPQGGVMSPYLSNLICQKLDNLLGAFAKENRFRYTRYADDLTFSSNAFSDYNQAARKLIEGARKIIEDEGFVINESKTMVMPSHQRQLVTGIVVNDGVNVNRKYIRNIRATLKNCEERGVRNAMLKDRFRNSHGHRFASGIKKAEFASGIKKAEKSFLMPGGNLVNQSQAMKCFLQQIEGRILYMQQVAQANSCETRSQRRLKLALKLRHRLHHLLEYQKLFGDTQKDILNKELEYQLNQASSIKEIKEALDHERACDLRLLAFEVKSENPKKAKSQINQYLANNPYVSKETVADLLRFSRQSEAHILGKVLHGSEIYIHELDEFIERDLPKNFKHRVPDVLYSLISTTLYTIRDSLPKELPKQEPISLSEPQLNTAIAHHVEKLHDLRTIRYQDGIDKELDKIVEKLTAEPERQAEICFSRDEFQRLELVTHVPSLLKGIQKIIKSMLEHTKGKTITLRVEHQSNRTHLIIQDDFLGDHFPTKSARNEFVGGDLVSAMKTLWGYCSWEVKYKTPNGSYKINLLNSLNAVACEDTGGFQHTLTFSRLTGETPRQSRKVLLIDNNLKRRTKNESSFEELNDCHNRHVEVRAVDGISKEDYEKGSWDFVFIHWNNDERGQIWDGLWENTVSAIIYFSGEQTVTESNYKGTGAVKIPDKEVTDWAEQHIFEES